MLSFFHDALIGGCPELLLEAVQQSVPVSIHCWKILESYCEMSFLAASLQDQIVIGLTHK